MPRLDLIVAALHPQKTHPRSRRCLVTLSFADFPIPIMDQVQTLIYEISMGMRNNIMRVSNRFDPVDYGRIDLLSPERTLLFKLALLHALILERLQFGGLGWNVFYPFNPSDFMILRRHL
jgi:dynein heavy chain